MKQLAAEERLLLEQICQKHNVDPNHLSELLLLEHAFSLKSSARKTRLNKTIKDRVKDWVNEHDDEVI